MSGLFITDEQVAHSRELARDITEPLFSMIDRNTTVSVERTVLRWFGVDGTGSVGAPLVNLMVDRLQQAGVLNRGAAYWYGRVFPVKLVQSYLARRRRATDRSAVGHAGVLV